MFSHLYPIDELLPYFSKLDSSNNGSNTLIDILMVPTHPQILQICVYKNEEQDLKNLALAITMNKNNVLIIKQLIQEFVDKYLTRNKKHEHVCDIIRYCISCYNDGGQKRGCGIFSNDFMFHFLFFFFKSQWVCFSSIYELYFCVWKWRTFALLVYRIISIVDIFSKL